MITNDLIEFFVRCLYKTLKNIAFLSSKLGAESVEKLFVRIYQLKEEKREYEARIAFLEQQLNTGKNKK
ncbi:MAG: hypothetical protein H9W81_15030 [Enterococcus sp.]|nr:hypothetical protein [Enterococcus sp.]